MAGRQDRIVQEALSRGAEHHRAGRWREAGAAYADALRADPDNVDANTLLGGVLLRLERAVEALALLDRAVRRDPRHPVAQLNRGRALLALDRAGDALVAFDAALAARPAFPEAAAGRARALLAAGRAADAVAAVGALLARGPATADLWALHGAALLAAGHPIDAETSIRQALAARPYDARERSAPPAPTSLANAQTSRARERSAPPAPTSLANAQTSRARLYVDLGACLLARDAPEAAADAWDHAAGLAPDLPGLEARRLALARSTGLARLAAGEPEAVAWLRRALALDPADRGALVGLADALFQHPALATTDDLARLLAADGLDHQRLARAVERAAPFDAAADDNAADDTAADDTAADDTPADDTPADDTATPTDIDTLPPLLAAWLRRAVVTNPDWLVALRALRRRLVARVLAGEDAPLDTLRALATQAWNTEHADVDADDEALADALAAGPATPVRLAAFATIRPLPAWPRLPDLTAPCWEALGPLVQQQFVAPQEERALADALPNLPSTGDVTSGIVSAMYEENPYPRLISVHRGAPLPFADRVRSLLPGLAELNLLPTHTPTRVLVAGGGTGQHPIGVAAGLTDAEIVAIDLSRASLGRAARLARAHGVTNVRFVQGDILALGTHDGLGTFDFVDCVGVLHHLADPLAGGRALVSKLSVGGLLRLGLYSERGRADVVAARALAAAHAWQPTPAGLRAARAALLALPAEHPAAGLAASVDLYSQSGLRDLVFHPCEHRYTPAQVGELVAALGLTVLGLQHARPEPARLYRARWPDDAAMADLGRWDELEAEHPRLFAGMIHVWCRRR